MVNRVRVKAFVVLAAVFALGVIVGGALFHAYSRHRMIDRFGREAPMFERDHRERALVKKLDLNDDQEAKLHAIFDRHGDKQRDLADAMLQECGAPLKAHQEQMDNEIRALLNPEQLPRFERMLERRSKKRARP